MKSKRVRREEAEARQELFDKLSTKEKLARAERRGAKKEIAKWKSRLEK